MPDTESVLVTGGAGFIGSHTVERLLARGCRVRVLDNLSSGTRANLPMDHAGLELLEGDVTDADVVSVAMQGMEYCLHLAAQVSVDRSVREPAFSCRQNVLGFVHVLDAVRRHGVRRLIYASSAAVYGNPVSLPVSEEAEPVPISPYGLEKQIDEQYAALFERLHGLSSLGLRYFNVYGPRQDPSSHYAGVISIFVSRLQRGEAITIYGDGSQSRDFIYVGDVARANERALFGHATGVCNVATGRSLTLLELVHLLSKFSGCCETDFRPPRDGDIHDSLADVNRMAAWLAMRAETPPEEGLRLLWDACTAARVMP